MWMFAMGNPSIPGKQVAGAGIWVGFAILYLVTPLVVAGVARGASVLPVLWVVALGVCTALLVDPHFDRACLFSWRGTRRHLPQILARAGLLAVVSAAALMILAPQQLFDLPRRNIRLWALVMCCYPLLSVVPQAVIYRVLFFHRFGVLFRSRYVLYLVSGAAFSLAHLVFANVWAMVLTFVGGVLLARTYDQTRLMPLTCLEHALYGNVCFTIGLGRYLCHGTQALLTHGG